MLDSFKKGFGIILGIWAGIVVSEKMEDIIYKEKTDAEPADKHKEYKRPI